MLKSRVMQLAATVVFSGLVLTGCARKAKNPELRLTDTSAFQGGSQNGSDLAAADGTSFAPNSNPWGPGGAPPVDGAGSGTRTGKAPFGAGSGNGASFDASGSLMNDGSASGVDGAYSVADLEMIHFEYDQAELSPNWTGTLDHHAEWMKSNPAVNIQVEGHCDERGTEEYNVSLGQRRADAVRQYLVDKGVDAARITTISYGKLRPMAIEDTEESHALNRRAMFLVYSPSAGDTTTAAAAY